MKLIAKVARYLVGIIFIFSGLIKLNDPVGTQIKLEEYFEVFSQDLPFMHDAFIGMIPYALFLSVFLCTAEVVLGIALIVGYRPKTTNFLLLLIIIFFSILTFYSAYFNKVTDCGCFGDAIKLKPWTSFTKDVVLLILIGLIIYYQKEIKPTATGLIVALSTAGSLGLAFYAIRHYPPLDLLAYKIGNNIPQLMKPTEEYRFEYVFEKEGKEVRTETYPTDTTYIYKDMITLNADEAKPKITDYRVWNDETDYTQVSLEGKKLYVIIKNLKDINTAAFPEIRTLIEKAESNGITPLILTSANGAELTQFLATQNIKTPFYYVDGTVLKTISRSNPGIWLLNDGTVKGKWHYNDTPTLEEVLKVID